MRNTIKNTRLKLNMTREELANRADISANSLRELEHGKVIPTISLAREIAKILNSKIEKIFKL